MTKEQEEQVNRAKELAACKAFEVYAESLEYQLSVLGLPLGVLDQTVHSHDAILREEGGKPVLYAKCTWEFSTHPAIIAAAVEKLMSETT